MKKVFGRVLLVYAAVLIGWSALSLSAVFYPKMQNLVPSFSKPTLVVANKGYFYSGDVEVNGQRLDTEGHFNPDPATHPNDVDVWVFVLDELAEIESYGLDNDLGLDTQEIARSAPGTVTSVESSSLHLRWSPLPLYLKKRQVFVVDAGYFEKNYRGDCLQEYVYRIVLGDSTAKVEARCKLN